MCRSTHLRSPFYHITRKQLGQMTVAGRKLTRPGGGGGPAAAGGRRRRRAAGGGGGMETDLANSGTGRIKTYGVDVPFMQLQRHDWDIHIV
jgi:hypothetical protein